MCGIWAFLQKKELPAGFDARIQKAVDTLKARGPDDFQIRDFDNGYGFKGKMAFARLAINGLTAAGNQPFEHDGRMWICNGEIYNHVELEQQIDPSRTYGSDCEILGEYLHNSHSTNPLLFMSSVIGVFAFIGINTAYATMYISRDRFGVRPLYYVETEYGFFYASHRKALEPICLSQDDKIKEFSPGFTYSIQIVNGNIYKVDIPIFHPAQLPTSNFLPVNSPTIDSEELIRDALEKAVDMRLMSDRPVGALLSGGLDSSLIAAIVQQKLKERGKPPLKTFSIGMEGSEDLRYARIVAHYIGSDHTEVIVTADEMFACIPDVIRDIESYDITTVRASVGNWMVSRYIAQNSECKVIFNGDGSDEVFGSYLYFYNAPSPADYEAEVRRLLSQIHRYDVLRSDRSISSHGLEPRTPYLDYEFVKAVFRTPLWMRQPIKGQQMEKWILRSAFSNRYGKSILPAEVLNRRKEAFSDGVSGQTKPWYQEIQDRIQAQNLVPSTWKNEMGFLCPQAVEVAPPQTPEAYYYMMLFTENYPHIGDPMPYWMPRWSPETSDPSARTLASY